MTSRFDPFQPPIQFVVVATMYGSLLLAVAISGALAETGLLFASTYVAIQVGRTLFFVGIVRGHNLRRVNMLALIWFGASAVPWLAGAFAPEVTRNSLWTVALAIDYLGARLGWPVPGLGARGCPVGRRGGAFGRTLLAAGHCRAWRDDPDLRIKSSPRSDRG